jgi:hypothetical protein
MLLKERQNYVQPFSLVSVGYFMMLSMSRQYAVQDIMINEYGAFGGIKTGRKPEILGENLPY